VTARAERRLRARDVREFFSDATPPSNTFR
jgi:hypothetical protein